jgi:hypothetical protein
MVEHEVNKRLYTDTGPLLEDSNHCYRKKKSLIDIRSAYKVSRFSKA